MTFETFDRAYLEGLQRGDATIEEHFIKYFSALIVMKMRSRGWERDVTDDVSQETFARALLLIRKPGGVQEPASLGSLVNSIHNNVLREYCRTRQRTDPLDDETAAMLTEPRKDALARVLEQDTGAVVSRVLKQMKPRDRELLREVLMEESDKDTVCGRMGVSRDHLRVLLHRAKHSFRDRYLSSQTPGRATSAGEAVTKQPGAAL